MSRQTIPRDFSGKGNKIDEKSIPKSQIEMGIASEMEHTKNRALAKRIALDHLAENPRYYTYLKRMERQMKLDELKKKKEAQAKKQQSAHATTKPGKEVKK